MRKIIILSFLAILFGCSNVKTTFNNLPYNEELNHDPTLKKLGATDTNKGIVYFTGGFDKDSIQMVSDKEPIVSKTITTGSNTGLATFEVISNEKNIEITIFSIVTKVVLPAEKLKKYKCVYISRNGENVLIEYSNTFKLFV